MILVYRKAIKRVATAIVAVVALAGCNGGTVDKHALQKDSERIGSFAAEGELLAHDVSKGASTEIFTRVHAKELAVAMSDLADSLGDRPTSPGIEAKVRRASKLAATVSRKFEQLHLHPTDHLLAKKLEDAFHADGDAADALSK